MSAGRLNGIEIARTEWYREGRVPFTRCVLISTTRPRKRRRPTGSSASRCGFKGDTLGRNDAPVVEEVAEDKRPRRNARPGDVVRAVTAKAALRVLVVAHRARRRQARRRQDWRITMLQPKRRKYRKEQKGRNTGKATRGNAVSFGEFGLKAIGRGRLTARQIEAARRAMTRHIKRGGRI